MLRGACSAIYPTDRYNLARELSLPRPWPWTYGAHLILRVIADFSPTRPPWFPLLSFLVDSKTDIRQRAKKFRDQLAISPDWAFMARDVFLDAIPVAQGVNVSVYSPVKSEMDTSPLVEALWGRGVTVCLPIINPD